MDILSKFKKYRGIFILLMVIAVGFYVTRRDEKSLSINKKIALGKVTNFKYKTKRGFISYEFYVEGRLYKTSDPDRSGWTTYVRDVKAEKGKFYSVEYDKDNPNNSKIVINENSKSFTELLRYGIKKNGVIEEVYAISDNYFDLYISYHFLQGDFKFRTRMHKDSLSCRTPEACKGANIELIFSPEFPGLNNLYHKSYDRIKRIEAKNKR